jgi:hypothetical protein
MLSDALGCSEIKSWTSKDLNLLLEFGIWSAQWIIDSGLVHN